MLGRPLGWFGAYCQAMRDRYGVVVRLAGGCIVTESIVARMEAYNDVSKKAIRERFGRDVDRETLEEQRELWYSMQPPDE
jgi:hypothetical protein